MYFKKIIQKEHFDHVIITHSLFYRYFKNLDNLDIIYDIMMYYYYNLVKK